MVIWYEIIFWISFSTYLIPLLTIILSRKRSKKFNSLELILLLFSLLTISTDLMNFLFMYIFENSNPVIHIYTILAYVLITVLYLNVFQKQKLKSLLRLLSIPTIGYFIFEFVYDSGYLKINTIPYLILTIYSILLSSIYFYIVYSEMKIANLFKDGLFWINSAFLIYFSSTFYVSLFEEYIRSENSELLYYTWPIQLVSTILFNAILSRGIWLMRKQ